jgi:tRNA threonylcarbamoyladenosine biosynthesis protein TsaE
MQKQFIIPSLSDLPEAVKWVLAQANGKQKIMLYGDMGAGKTTFTKAFCNHFGVTDTTSSPTFSLVNEYRYMSNGVKKMIHHLDLYRLKNLDEALDLALKTIFSTRIIASLSGRKSLNLCCPTMC